MGAISEERLAECAIAGNRSPEEGAPLAIRLFGPLEVRVQGELLAPLRTRKGELLLSMLALRAGRGVPRDSAAATLWPESTGDTALANLRRSLTDLRRALGPAASLLQAPASDTLRLDPAGVHADVVLFDRAIALGDTSSLEEAVSLYRGPLLAGRLEGWVIPEREAREQAYLAALETLANHAMARGNPEKAANHLRRAASVQPLRQATQRRLMEALVAGGDYAAAKRVYVDLCARLDRELSSDPDAETSALFGRIREVERRRSAPRSSARHDTAVRGARGVSSALRATVSASIPGGSALPGWLPRPVSSLVGRRQELKEVGARLSTSRLLTLTGPGGIGKTRLAIQAAEERIPLHPAGVWFVDLAPLAGSTLLPHAVASLLGVKEQPSHPILATLKRELRDLSLLLVLDNCEHLVDGCARLAEALLLGCPGVRVLATSRQPLGVSGEVTLRVPPLGSADVDLELPDDEAIVAALMQADAVRLFVERASVARPGWEADSRSIRTVAHICRRLDGNALAIELAAARVRALPVEQIAARLDDRFRLLTGGSRTASPRQQTLQGALDWSYDLLTPPEQSLLARMSVFSGGWTLEAAEAVGSPTCPSVQAPAVLDILTALVDKSLVVYEEAAGESHYRLLETVRQYARDRLAEAGKEDLKAVHLRHTRYLLKIAEDAARDASSADHRSWLDRIAADLDNLTAVLARSVEEDPEIGLRLAIALSPFWTARNRLSQASHWMDRLLSRASDASPRVRATAFWHAGLWKQMQGDPGGASGLYEQGLAIARAAGDTGNVASALYQLSLLACERADYRQALPMLEESIRLHEGIGDVTFSLCSWIRLGIAYHHLGEEERAREMIEEGLALARAADDRIAMIVALDHLGDAAADRGDYPAARAFHGEKLALARLMDEPQEIARTLIDLARLSWRVGDHSDARARQEEALAVARGFGGVNLQTQCLNHMAQLASVEGDLARMRALSRESLELAYAGQLVDRVVEALRQLAGAATGLGSAPRAVRLLAAAEMLQERAGVRPSPGSRALLECTVKDVHGALDEEAFAAAWAEGSTMTMEETVAYALGDSV